jgi:succinate dehydrogenase/fumarate reductase flavoprotein subunit
MNADATSEQTVVIVGAGLAGGKAAVTLREEGWRAASCSWALETLLAAIEAAVPS